MEFVRERRAWEERLKRRAPMDDSIDEDMEMEMEMEEEEGEGKRNMPSPTEEREIEELLKYLEMDQAQGSEASRNDFGHNEEEMSRQTGSDTISDDEDYDQLFMEVIGDNGDFLQDGTHGGQESPAPQQSQDSIMDLS